MITLVLAASVVIGVSLGVLGGGSILTVPILVYLAGQGSKEAIATSLFVVGVTSLVGLAQHARAGRVRWRTGARLRQGRHRGAAGAAAAFGISSIPTLMAVRDRTVLYARPGALPPQALEELIGKVRAVDMDAVRREAAGAARN